MSQDIENRRKYLRINHSQIVSYTHYNDSDEIDKRGGMGTTSDISMGGVLIRIADEFTLNTKIELEISLGDNLIQAIGEIRRIQPVEGGLYDLGVEFVDIDVKDLKLLREFFSERNIPLE